eukprot:CAMPEP_0184867672 /NCGR_PEP_ID=MMETSP0580-20130426/27461_1 /TAXON_ID=1118495 /ORGANISM="Dactyliosolen fragilissimus" /LENGTH=1087 /DNA_ID=CAMNT_0027368095 /DNA_START=373 /DNA_END=3636 /DNA_ORIENTATION=+
MRFPMQVVGAKATRHVQLKSRYSVFAPLAFATSASVPKVRSSSGRNENEIRVGLLSKGTRNNHGSPFSMIDRNLIDSIHYPKVTNSHLFSTKSREKIDVDLPYFASGEDDVKLNEITTLFVNEENTIHDTLKSKPKEGGSWKPDTPLAWAENFGRRDPETTAKLFKLAKLSPDDEGYFDVTNEEPVQGVTMVKTVEQARIVLNRLMSDEAMEVMHACDTEVMEINLKDVGPVGNGYVSCVSIYSGPNFDYGLGDGPGTTLWIDNLDESFGLLQNFKKWFEDERFLKVWHNYGFDRHVMWNEGILVKGFGGDTMHMARLEDTSRARSAVNGGTGNGGGYSLEALTDDLLERRKAPMKELFGISRLRKDGSVGSLVDIPNVEVLQRDPRFRENWITYSAYDAEGTWLLHETLKKRLTKIPWFENKNLYEYYELHMRKFGEVLTDMERRGIRVNAMEYLPNVEIQARKDRAQHDAAFRKWAFEKIGPDGLALNLASSTQLCTFLFGGAQNEKTREMTEKVRVFKTIREDIPEDALKAYEESKEREAKMNPNMNPQNDFIDKFDSMKAVQLKALCKERGLKVSGKKSELQERLRGHFLSEGSDITPQDDFESMSDENLKDSCRARGLSDQGNRNSILGRLRDDSSYAMELLSASTDKSTDGYRRISEALERAAKEDGALKEILAEIDAKSKAKPKYVDVTVTSIGMKPEKFTAGGAPSVTADVLRKLAGDPFANPPKYGSAYEFFGGGSEGHKACVAFYSLTAIGSIDTMIANFLTSLQNLADHDSRVHCSLNLNTETGRLSSRRPNLQNQPALEKDKYKIRQAFQASPGNNLIVADYGQLELRLLASMTNCKSMIEAFEAGGDFHSRTAMGMFNYIQEKVDNGDCLLEWDYSNGDPPKPMLKDEFASERRKAKTLNFSIAYGKTAFGLSQDWGVSTEEAENMLKAWYNSRPEVEKWQRDTKDTAQKYGFTRTLHGRYRQLPGAVDKNNRQMLGHALRASINTPIQGGAADVAMMAMIKINESEKLKRLGWILLMQIHDEVILEGPEESAEEAFEEVLKCMQAPWALGLEPTSVPLLVDGSFSHKNWYDAK